MTAQSIQACSTGVRLVAVLFSAALPAPVLATHCQAMQFSVSHCPAHVCGHLPLHTQRHVSCTMLPQHMESQMMLMISNWDFSEGSKSIVRMSLDSGLQMVPVIRPSAFCSFQLMLLMCT